MEEEGRNKKDGKEFYRIWKTLYEDRKHKLVKL
jgi:hypothetical protein